MKLTLGTKVPTAIYTDTGEPVCIVDSMRELGSDTATARRLVACWNACQGISTENLEQLPPLDGQLDKMAEKLTQALNNLADSRRHLHALITTLREDGHGQLDVVTQAEAFLNKLG